MKQAKKNAPILTGFVFIFVEKQKNNAEFYENLTPIQSRRYFLWFFWSNYTSQKQVHMLAHS